MQQITIIVRDTHKRVIADISARLAEADINIDMLDADGFEDNGIIHLEVSDFDTALELLRVAGYQTVTEESLVVKIADKPGSLAKIARQFDEADIDIRSMRIVKREEDFCIVAIVVDKISEARELLGEALVA